MFFNFILKRLKKNLQEDIKYRFNMNKWMELTKQERLEIDYKEKNESMKKKKALLKSIREEYIKIKKNK